MCERCEDAEHHGRGEDVCVPVEGDEDGLSEELRAHLIRRTAKDTMPVSTKGLRKGIKLRMNNRDRLCVDRGLSLMRQLFF